jgi:hypothetical protein
LNYAVFKVEKTLMECKKVVKIIYIGTTEYLLLIPQLKAACNSALNAKNELNVTLALHCGCVS